MGIAARFGQGQSYGWAGGVKICQPCPAAAPSVLRVALASDHSPVGSGRAGSLKVASGALTVGVGMQHILWLSNPMTVARAGEQRPSWVHTDSQGMDMMDLQLLAHSGGFLLGQSQGCLGHRDSVEGFGDKWLLKPISSFFSLLSSCTFWCLQSEWGAAPR